LARGRDLLRKRLEARLVWAHLGAELPLFFQLPFLSYFQQPAHPTSGSALVVRLQRG
jgi:hypothetical protein